MKSKTNRHIRTAHICVRIIMHNCCTQLWHGTVPVMFPLSFHTIISLLGEPRHILCSFLVYCMVILLADAAVRCCRNSCTKAEDFFVLFNKATTKFTFNFAVELTWLKLHKIWWPSGWELTCHLPVLCFIIIFNSYFSEWLIYFVGSIVTMAWTWMWLTSTSGGVSLVVVRLCQSWMMGLRRIIQTSKRTM